MVPPVCALVLGAAFSLGADVVSAKRSPHKPRKGCEADPRCALLRPDGPPPAAVLDQSAEAHAETLGARQIPIPAMGNGTGADDSVDAEVTSCFHVCHLFDPQRKCQCNTGCAKSKDCCADYGTYCFPNRKPSYTVGKAVAGEDLLKFWTAAAAIFVGFAMPAAYICRPSPVYRNAPDDGDTRIDADYSDKESASDLGDPISELAPDQSGSKSEKYELQGGWWGLRFADPAVEKHWHSETFNARIREGAKAGVAALCAVMIRLYIRFDDGGHAAGHRASPSIGMALTALLFAPFVGCWIRPNPHLFGAAVIISYLWLPSISLTPLSLSCYDLHLIAGQREDVKGVGWLYHGVQLVDCSLPGLSCMQILMLWILFTPWIMPQTEYIRATWFWIVGAFFCWSVTYCAITGERIFDAKDLVNRVLVLAGTHVVAIIIKYNLESFSRLNYAHHMKHKDEAKKLFRILEYVMPKHVIGPMLMDAGPIAESIDQVSIMFVLIDGFDEITRSYTPSQLLKFLNSQFTAMDRIIEKSKVTKIETVGEEYVAAVGVLPSDVAVGATHGHRVLLERLTSAAKEILYMQTEEVRFKMGIHTGPIVAGVIGTKLPRFRLFGDTINSAARMMQTAPAGRLQFGQQTYECLSESFKAQVTDIGDVQWKGIGAVHVFSYDGGSSGDLAKKGTGGSGWGHAPGGRRRSLVEAMVATRLPSDEEAVDADFEECLEVASAPGRSSKHWFLGEREGFDREAEEEWVAQFHRERFLAGVDSRMGLACLLGVAITGFEMVSMIENKTWLYPHQAYKNQYRLPIFVYSRGAAIFVFMFWWWAVGPGTCGWAKTHPRMTQWLVVLSTMAVIVLLFLGYDALTYSDSVLLDQHVFHKIHQPFRAQDDVVMTLHFNVCYIVLMLLHPVPFFIALLYLPGTLACMNYGTILRWLHVIDSDSSNIPFGPLSSNGLMLIFVQTALCLFLAHDDENSSRRQFKAQKVLDWTETRTTVILDTLMPHLVVDAVAKLPPNAPWPTNSYRHATLAQSALCGLNAFASTKSPAQVVQFMSDLFGAYDKLGDIHKVYKVETVGDAYIAGVAERPLTPENSPVSVIVFALDMVRVVDEWAKGLGANVTCRVGVAYGECIGGIVGKDMQRYHLFGDTLVVMDITEATSVEGRVQVTTACKLEVERELVDHPAAASEQVTFTERQGALTTSKGYAHSLEDVGGPTYLVESDKPLRRK